MASDSQIEYVLRRQMLDRFEDVKFLSDEADHWYDLSDKTSDEVARDLYYQYGRNLTDRAYAIMQKIQEDSGVAGLIVNRKFTTPAQGAGCYDNHQQAASA